MKNDILMMRKAMKKNKNIANAHSLHLFLILILISLFGMSCKKNSTSPQVEDLTRPVIWVNVSEITFSTFAAGGSVEPQTLEVKNTGVNPLNYSVAADAEWVQIEPAAGSSTGETVEHRVTVDKSGLGPREEPYSSVITVDCPESYNNPQTVSVSLKIDNEPPPKLWISPQNLNFSAQINGNDPASQQIEIKNSAQGTLRYEISADKSWITVTPDSGQSKGNTRRHTVSVSAAGLGSGDHKATLTVRDRNASNSPRRIQAILSLSKEPLPEIWVNTRSLNFSASTGGGDPAPKSIRIKNSGGGTLKYTVSEDASWLSVNPNSGQSTGAERSHTVSVNKSGLSAGNYSAQIAVADSSAVNSPQKVNISLNISAPLTDNSIWISCNPSSASKGTVVNIPVSIRGNQNEIKVFGMELHFDSQMFQYQNTDSGDLTGGWAAVDGNEISSGVIKIGGFAGSANPIAVGSEGKIAVIKLKVTGDGYGDGQKSTLSISAYTDAVAGMKPEPAKTTFTLDK